MPLPVNAKMIKKYMKHRASMQEQATVQGLFKNLAPAEVAAIVADPDSPAAAAAGVAPADWGQDAEDFFDDHLTWGNILKLGAVSLIGGFAVSRVLGGVEFTKEKTYAKK